MIEEYKTGKIGGSNEVLIWKNMRDQQKEVCMVRASVEAVLEKTEQDYKTRLVGRTKMAS